MRTIRNVYHVDDRKNEDGLWMATFMYEGFYCHTRSSTLWQNMLARCKIPDRSTNLFSDYQQFAEWCQTQHGYMEKELNGNFWALDKDILIPGNKNYSPELCCFIPTRLNTVLSIAGYKTKPSKLPMGVSKGKKDGIFRASIRIEGANKFLGYYETAIEAHQSWQRAKLEILTEALKCFNFLPQRILQGVEYHIDIIRQDLRNLKETVRT